MVKMEICSDPYDQHISKLNETSVIAYRIRKARCGVHSGFGKFKPRSGSGGGAKVFLPVSKEVLFGTNGSFVLPVQCSSETLAAPSTLLLESLLSKGKNTNAALEDPVATSDSKSCRSPGKSAQTATIQSDGESHEGNLQRSPLPICHREVSTQFAMGTAGAPGSFSQSQVLPKNFVPLPHISKLFSVAAGKGPSSEILGVATERREARGKLPATRKKDPSERTDSRRRSNTVSATPPNPALTTRPGNGPRTTAPTGVDPQGPSPIDYSMELEAEFPTYMVIEMQSNAAKKARRTVIGRTLGGRATFKALHECLKLHLPTSFSSTTLLTRGYFLILFENEEGAIATRKLTTVD
jgi:hypothetical protein